MSARVDALKGYVLLTWGADSELSGGEQETIEAQRRDLWRSGVARSCARARCRVRLRWTWSRVGRRSTRAG